MGLDCRTLKGMLFLLLLPSFSAFFWSLAFAAGIVDDAHLLLLPRLCSYYRCICSAAVCCGPGESLLRLELGLYYLGLVPRLAGAKTIIKSQLNVCLILLLVWISWFRPRTIYPLGFRCFPSCSGHFDQRLNPRWVQRQLWDDNATRTINVAHCIFILLGT